MQRLAVTLSAFALIFVMVVNIALFVQNTKLRQQTGTAQLQPTQAGQSPEQPSKIADLQQQLERSEQDRLKAARDANTARNQLNQLQGAAKERDTLKAQAQSLQQENQQLKSEVGNLQTMNTINGQVVPLRGLKPLQNVPRNFMNHDQLRDYFTAELNQEWPPEAEQRERAIEQALDMGSGKGDIRQAQIDSMVKGVLGFYDQNTKQLVVVTEHAKMSVLDKVTYAHEFTHSLQDQHYDLTTLFARAKGNADYASAIRALVEGDATVTMGRYANKNFNAIDRANYQLEQFKDINLSGIMSGGGGGGPMVESATYFPYEEGAQFVALLYKVGGVKAVDAAFKNPPRSSEQILHPESYFNGDEPIAVRLPALALNGWHTVSEDTLGELYVRIYLEYQLPFEEVLPATSGWGGDRYAVLSDDQGRLALAFQTAWDSPRDAEQFFNAYNDYVFTLAGGNPQVLQSDSTHMRWQFAGRQFYLSHVGKQVLALHAPDAATLDALIAKFKGF